MAGFTINQKQMDEFMNKVVESFSGKDFTLEDIKSLCNFKKEKKEKKVKDPDAPKRALSAWIYFTTAKRPEVKEQNPEKKTTELTTIMSEMWRDYTDEQKQPYKDMEIADKERYQKEKVDYESNSDQSESDTDEKSDKKAKKVKDPNAPKRNLNSYMIFCRETRAKHVDVKHTAAVLKTMWADLEDKSEYTDMAKEAKEMYLKEKAAYESNK
jgi:hypothetical protein